MRFSAILVFLLTLLPFLALAQPQTETQEEPTLNLTTPRETFATFLELFTQGNIEDAVIALDLSALDPEDQILQRFELTRRLGEILQTDTWDIEDIPEQPESALILLRTYTRQDAAGETVGSISLSRNEENLWKFSPETVDRINALWDFRVKPNLEQPSTPTNPTQTENPEVENGEALDIPEELSSPRATLETFFLAMNEEPANLAKARETLDLSDSNPLTVDYDGDQAARTMFGIFNRTLLVDIESYSEKNDADPVSISIEVERGRIKESIGSIRIARQADGTWKFTADTIADLPEMWAQVQDLPVIGNLKDITPFQSGLNRWLKSKFPESWQEGPILGLKPWQWVTLPLALIISWLAGVVVRVLVKLYIRFRTKWFGDIITPKLMANLGRAISLSVNATVLTWLARQLNLPSDWKAAVLFIVLVTQIVGISWLAINIIEVFLAVLDKKSSRLGARTEKLVIPMSRNFARALIVIGAFIVFLSKVGIDITNLVAGLGIGGLVVALAAKDSVENIFGSFTVLFEMPFQIGDWVIIDDIEGTVEQIAVRTTRIRTFQDSLIMVPNSKFISAHVENMGRRRYRRIKTTIGITYDTPPDTIEEFIQRLRDMVDEHPHTWKAKRHIVFNDFGASSLDIMLYIFVEAPDWGKELLYREDILLRIVRIASELGVEFAFPTQTTIFDGKNSTGTFPVEIKNPQ